MKMVRDTGQNDRGNTDVILVRPVDSPGITPLPVGIHSAQEDCIEQGEITQEDLDQYIRQLDGESTAECHESEISTALVTEVAEVAEDPFADFFDDPELSFLTEDAGGNMEFHRGVVESLSSGSLLLEQTVRERYCQDPKITESQSRVLYDPRSTPDPTSRPGDSRLNESDPTPIPYSPAPKSPVPLVSLGDILEESDGPGALSPEDADFIRGLRESGKLTDMSQYCFTPGDAQDIFGTEVIHQGFDDITLVFALLDQIKKISEKILGTGNFSLSLEDGLSGGHKEGFINFDNPDNPDYAITMLTGTDGLVRGSLELKHSGRPNPAQLEEFVMKGADLVGDAIPHLLKGESLRKRGGVNPRKLVQEIQDIFTVYKVCRGRAQRDTHRTLLLPKGKYSLEFFRGPYKREPIVRLALGWSRIYDTHRVQFMPYDQYSTMIVQFSDGRNIPRAYEFYPKDTKLKVDEELTVIGPGGRRYSMATPGIDPFME